MRPNHVWQPAGFLVLASFIGFALARLPLSWSTLILAGSAVVLLSLLHPLLGLGLTLLAGPLGALENVLLGGGLLDSGQILLLLTLASWIAGRLRRRRLVLSSTSLILFLAFFIYIASASLLNASDKMVGFKELLKWIEIGLLMLMVSDLASPSDDSSASPLGLPAPAWWVILSLLIAGLAQAMVGIWQFGIRGSGPDHFVILGRFYRAYGTFEQPNPFGGYVNLTAMLALGLLMGLVAWWAQAIRSRSPSGNRSIGAWAGIQAWQATTMAHYLILMFVAFSALASSLALIFSWSRGAWLGFAAGIMMILLFWAKNRWHGLAWFGFTIVIAVGLYVGGSRLGLVPAGVVERISSFGQYLQFGDMRGVDINDANYSVFERLAHWQAAFDMARDNPWLGVGFGNYETAYGDYALINWPDALGHAHNYYLNLLAETGILGLAAYLLFWGVVYWQTLRAMGQMEWPARGVPLGLLGAWTALSVHHLVDKLYVNNNYLFLGVMMALLSLLSSGKRYWQDPEKPLANSWDERRNLVNP